MDSKLLGIMFGIIAMFSIGAGNILTSILSKKVNNIITVMLRGIVLLTEKLE